jgi:hypothetical protein
MAAGAAPSNLITGRRVRSVPEDREAIESTAHAAEQKLDWRPGRVYFLTLLVPSRDDRTLALTPRSASRLPP